MPLPGSLVPCAHWCSIGAHDGHHNNPSAAHAQVRLKSYFQSLNKEKGRFFLQSLNPPFSTNAGDTSLLRRFLNIQSSTLLMSCQNQSRSTRSARTTCMVIGNLHTRCRARSCEHNTPQTSFSLHSTIPWVCSLQNMEANPRFIHKFVTYLETSMTRSNAGR